MTSAARPTALDSESTAYPRAAREHQAVFLLLLVAVNLALFLPSMNGDFLWDDKYFISENPNVLGGRFLKNFLLSPFGGFSGTDDNSVRQDRNMQFYRPLVSLTYWIDFKVWGLNPAAFHLTNILIHLVNVMVFFFILIGLSFRPRPAAFGALLFSVYPLHFENVSWISGRTDLLAFLFGGLSVLFFIRYLEKKAFLSLVASGTAFFLALLSKENVVFVPLIFLFVLYKEEGQPAKAFSSLWPFMAALLGWFSLRWNALGLASTWNSGRTVLDFLATVGFYSWKIVFPFQLSLTVDPLPVSHNLAFRILGAAILIAFVLSVWRALRLNLAKGWPYWTFLAYALVLLPSVLVIFSSAAISLVAWRFLYVPSAVMIAALVYFLAGRLKVQALTVGTVVLLAAVYAAEIYPKNSLFGKDETHFWLGLKNPEHEDVIARFNIGVKALPTDESQALRLFDSILSERSHPAFPYWKTRIFEELGIYYAFRRDFSKAESYFSELFRTQAHPSMRLRLNYTFYLAFSGKGKEGETIVREMLRQFPGNHYVITQAAKFYVIEQDYGRAAELYAEDYRLFRNRQSQLLAQEAAGLQSQTR